MPENSLVAYSVESLAGHCADQNGDNQHEPFCLELFRRAIAEQDETSWDVIYSQYRSLVRMWVVEMTRGSGGIEPDSIDQLALDAFAAFWRGFTSDKLAKAAGLGSVLKYLKSCAATSALQRQRHLRRQVLAVSHDEQLEGNPASEPRTESGADKDVLKRLYAEQLWNVVDLCCHDDRERAVARLSFVSGLTPARIMELRPDLFDDEKELYRIRRNLRNRLMRDPSIQALRQEFSSDWK